MISKFILLTGGRTGSTAIIDELNSVSSILAEQELFIKQNFRKIKDKYNKDKKPIPPFYLWKLFTPFRERIAMWFLGPEKYISKYLNEVENVAENMGVATFGFKTLCHHFDQTDGLLSNIIQRQYSVIYLTRSIPNQVLSGMVANKRGIYNTQESFHDGRSYKINLEEMKRKIIAVEWRIERDLALLKKNRLKFIAVTYEDYLNKKNELFKTILNFLDLPFEAPPPSSYSIMIKDLRDTIINYDEVTECIDDIGMAVL